jgi:hypothetical protein
MKKIGFALLASSAIILHSLPASAQTPPTPSVAAPAKPLSICEGLARDWKSVEYELADNYADGVTDDSAPRATMRAVQDQNALLKAQIALALMRDNKCPLPKRAPSSLTYMIPAMTCKTEKLKGNYKAPACDYSTWTPIGQ